MNDEEFDLMLRVADPVGQHPALLSAVKRQQVLVVAVIEDASISQLVRIWRHASRLKKTILASLALMLLGIFGTGSALVARNMLDNRSIQAINESDCNVSGTNARLVRKGTDSIGTEIEYWTVGSDSSVVDLVIRKSGIDGAAGGTNSCDHHERKAGEPFVSWSAYAMNDRVWHVAFFGWAPAKTIGKLHLSNGIQITLHPDVNGNIFELLEPGNISGVYLLDLDIIDSSGQLLRTINLNPENN